MSVQYISICKMFRDFSRLITDLNLSAIHKQCPLCCFKSQLGWYVCSNLKTRVTCDTRAKRTLLIIDPVREGRFEMLEGTVYSRFCLKEFKETNMNGINTLSSSGNPENHWKITRRLKDTACRCIDKNTAVQHCDSEG